MCSSSQLQYFTYAPSHSTDTSRSRLLSLIPPSERQLECSSILVSKLVRRSQFFFVAEYILWSILAQWRHNVSVVPELPVLIHYPLKHICQRKWSRKTFKWEWNGLHFHICLKLSQFLTAKPPRMHLLSHQILKLGNFRNFSHKWLLKQHDLQIIFAQRHFHAKKEVLAHNEKQTFRCNLNVTWKLTKILLFSWFRRLYGWNPTTLVNFSKRRSYISNHLLF